MGPTRQNEKMPDNAAFSSETVLSEDERQATESLLSGAWGCPVTVDEAKLIWGDGRSRG
jgi:hypothetical protein